MENNPCSHVRRSCFALLLLLIVVLGIPARSNAQDLDTAAQWIQTGRYQKALDLLRTVKKTGDNSSELENLLGAAHLQLRDFDNAKAAFESAIRLDPSHQEPKFNLAETCL